MSQSVREDACECIGRGERERERSLQWTARAIAYPFSISPSNGLYAWCQFITTPYPAQKVPHYPDLSKNLQG